MNGHALQNLKYQLGGEHSLVFHRLLKKCFHKRQTVLGARETSEQSRSALTHGGQQQIDQLERV